MTPFDDAEHDGLGRVQLVAGGRRGDAERGSDHDPGDVQHASSGGASASVRTPFAAANASSRASSSVTRRVTPTPSSGASSSEASTARTRAPCATTSARAPLDHRGVERREDVDHCADRWLQPVVGVDPHRPEPDRDETVQAVTLRVGEMPGEHDRTLEHGHGDDPTSSVVELLHRVVGNRRRVSRHRSHIVGRRGSHRAEDRASRRTRCVARRAIPLAGARWRDRRRRRRAVTTATIAAATSATMDRGERRI